VLWLCCVVVAVAAARQRAQTTHIQNWCFSTPPTCVPGKAKIKNDARVVCVYVRVRARERRSCCLLVVLLL
jgi:hypothetical protein